MAVSLMRAYARSRSAAPRAPAPMAGHCYLTFCRVLYNERGPTLLIKLSSLSSVQFSHSVVADSLWPYEPQHTRPPCPSPTPRVYPNLYPLSQWCYPTISSSIVHFSSHLQSFPASGSFSNESALRIRWPKYWGFSFNISPSSEYSGLTSFRMG